MSGFLRQELFSLPDQTSAALVLDLVLRDNGGFLGLDDAGAVLDTLGGPRVKRKYGQYQIEQSG